MLEVLILLGTFFLPSRLLLFLALSFTTDPGPIGTVFYWFCTLEVHLVLLLGVCFVCASILIFRVCVVLFIFLTPQFFATQPGDEENSGRDVEEM